MAKDEWSFFGGLLGKAIKAKKKHKKRVDKMKNGKPKPKVVKK